MNKWIPLLAKPIAVVIIPIGMDCSHTHLRHMPYHFDIAILKSYTITPPVETKT